MVAIPQVAFAEPEELSRRNAFRKKSIIGMLGKRLSFSRSYSTPVDETDGIEVKKNSKKDDSFLRRSK